MGRKQNIAEELCGIDPLNHDAEIIQIMANLP